MNKVIANYKFYLVTVGVIFGILSLHSFSKADINPENVDLKADIMPTLEMSFDYNSVDFGELVANNNPKSSDHGVKIGIKTNAPNGYYLAISDGGQGDSSALINSANSKVKIIDYISAITNPTLWNSGKSKGFGFSLYSADTNKESKWGTGDRYDDSVNKYAGVPENTTVFHSSPNFKKGVDNSLISFILDVAPDQQVGLYTGNITITAFEMLN